MNKCFVPVFVSFLLSTASLLAHDICLNGVWEYGYARHYDNKGAVPGIHTETSRAGEDTLWYRKDIVLPRGDWEDAVLELKGARFRPEIYINNELCARAEGGMIRTFHQLTSSAIKPGAAVRLEIALASLKDVPKEDASRIPEVDQWRSHCASALWDDVVLHLYRKAYIDRALTWYNHDSRDCKISFRICGSGEYNAHISISDKEEVVFATDCHATPGDNYVQICTDGMGEWSPKTPECYSLTITLTDEDGKKAGSYDQTFALKDFRTADKQFILNGNPIHFRGGTIVWHRWMRDPEGLELGWDSGWIEENIIKRLKDHGANYLRFHLGVPPERLLDLCDKYGLAVQYEWNFFHGMPASYESLMEQYPKWFDMAARHPSVMLYHPYNETENDSQLRTAWNALNTIVESYPPVVLEERDVIHIHKYWWSLFENLGLYYDSFDQFPKAIMVDEFGGNYLDGKADMGLYPSVRESFMRFLGPAHTAEQRLHHQDIACAKVAEYWRRLDAAGVSPFVIASSQEDGCNWFTGPLEDGNPKNVWNALTVLWSEKSISLDLWDRNFRPCQKIKVPCHFFNDGPGAFVLRYKVSILGNDGESVVDRGDHVSGAFSHDVEKIEITLPEETGDYILRAELLNPDKDVHHRVMSDWDIRILKAYAGEEVRKYRIYIPKDESELNRFAKQQGLTLAKKTKQADVILLGRTSFEKVADLNKSLQGAIRRGTSVVMLDVGERNLGQGYPEVEGNLGPLQGVTKVKDGKVSSYPLPDGIKMVCREMAEPESHIHPINGDTALWGDMNPHACDLWNGLRAGLIVPSSDIELEGLNEEAFMSQWESRGADKGKILQGGYYAYSLCGFYEFSSNPKDKELEKKMRKKVQFLIDDAPSLAMSLNAKAPVTVHNLGQGYLSSRNGKATEFKALCCAGKNLTRNPVVYVGFGKGKGKMIISQLLTEGRLDEDTEVSYEPEKFYGYRYDPAAVQMVLNMIRLSRTLP